MSDAVFFRLLSEEVEGKAAALLAKLDVLNAGGDVNEVFTAADSAFAKIPGSPFAYWVNNRLRSLFDLPKVAEIANVKQGLATADDFRFVHAWWEVHANSIGYSKQDTGNGCGWVHFAKGGAYSLYYADVFLVVDWRNEGFNIRNFFKPDGRLASRPQNIEHFFHAGLTWPLRTQKGLNVRAVSSGGIFGHKGPMIIANDDTDYLLSLLAVMNSPVIKMLIELQMAFGSYEVGVIQRTPVPENLDDGLSPLAHHAYNLQRERDFTDETTHVFQLPGLVEWRGDSLNAASLTLAEQADERARQLASVQAQIDEIVFDLYGLDDADRQLVMREMGTTVAVEDAVTDDEPDEDDEAAPPDNLPAQVFNLLMWCIGVAFGRWDVRKALEPSLFPPLPEPFDPLPRCAPGALMNAEGLPATREDVPEDYPLPIAWNGILIDDPAQEADLTSLDIVARVRGVLTLLWGENQEEQIEAEICRILGYPDLRAVFRDARQGLFAFHIKRYSKSRRKAPIYWLLQASTRSPNYGMWLYYPRIDGNTLYDADNIAYDKIRLEQQRLDDLKRDIDALDRAKRKQRDQEIAAQTRLVDEVTVFRKTVLRLANQNLPPDHNDGVLISIALLYELVPWKELGGMWAKLTRGEYTWSTMSARMRERGLINEQDKDSMGIVTEKLIALVRAQIQKHGTVVWYDADGVYAEIASGLVADQVGAEKVFRYDPHEGFFSLRHELEPHWQSLDLNSAPRLLIYARLAQAEAHHALIEYEVGGVVMQPGQSPPECNTDLAAVARTALEPIFPEARLAQLVDETTAVNLSLAELDQIAERGNEAQTGTLSVIFGTGNATEVMLRFLGEEFIDTKITERGAIKDVAKVFTDALGIEFNNITDPRGLRARAARQILMTDFFEALGENAAPPIPLAKASIALAATVDLAHQWRNRRDIAPAYLEWSGQIQTEIGIGSLEVSLDALARSETFAAAEVRLQILMEEALLKRPTTALIDLMRVRIAGFWSSQKPDVKTRWEVILNAGRVLQEVGRIETALKGKQWTASKLFGQYVYGESPWCGLDTAQRHLERDIHRYDLNPQQHDSLQRLIAQASQQYATMINRLAELFVQAYKDEEFELADVQLQADVYRDFVAPRVRLGRVAYVLVDAFRYEMAYEFVSLLATSDPNWDVQITPALATPPTITDVGMAALMPGAEDGIILTLEKGALVPQIGGKSLRTAKARLERITAAVGAEIVVTTLDDLAPLRKPALSKKLNEARVVVVTASDDIDGLGENMPQKARRSLDDVLSLLRRGLAALATAGIQEIIVTADHGFILADHLDDSQKIDAPGGDQQGLLKRRVWVGVGGASHPATMRTPLSAFGIGGKLELVTPIGLSAFKVQGGNSEYFHGGLALQEIVIPVMVVSSNKAVSAGTTPKLVWKLTLGSSKITSPYVSVTIEVVSNMLLPFDSFDPPTIRVEIRDNQQALSVPVSASYGFQDATKDVRLKLDEATRQIEKNTVMVYMSEKPGSAAVDLHLLDATTGQSLAILKNIPVNLFE